jgi:beta-galactosidase/beta-glucuronidase
MTTRSDDTVDAVHQDGSYPRPQLMRTHWHDLGGPWSFAFDGNPRRQPADVVFDREIIVPFPPESTASGIGDTGYHDAVWYRRTFEPADLAAAGLTAERPRVMLHFGAVDWLAEVWVNDRFVGRHEGGQTPFAFDITADIDPEHANEVVVRAVDDPHDVSLLRGKQDWREHPHAIWYHRTTGIWQPVWLECVPDAAIEALAWRTDLPTASVDLDVDFDHRVPEGSWLHVALDHDGETLAETRVLVLDRTCTVRLVLPRQRNGQQYEELLWSPRRPTLLGATVRLEDSEGRAIDTVGSYLGLRSVGTDSRRLLLNDRPMRLRAVLSQNYWPESHLAAPSAAALRREVELILELGFNAARVHQKAEDPRFLYWADRLGLMLWAETANAFAFDTSAMTNLTREWLDLVRRDGSHPSIITWVPLNESWGVQHISHDPRQRSFSLALAELTRSLDASRPVVSNDGWEHTDSDIWTVHDYEPDAAVLAERYRDLSALEAMLEGIGPAGRRMSTTHPDRGQPIMLTEFGGVSLRSAGDDEAWGYSEAPDADAFETHVCALLSAAGGSPVLAGYCYTQLTDTGQETNGLLYADRTPKIPIERMRAAVRGA